MAAFIDGLGGKARFDRYMAESLEGEDGFYNKRATIGTTGYFDTFSSDPALAELVAAHGTQGPDFAEMGGGEGTFKRNLLKINPKLHYISIEQSKKFAELQKTSPDENIIVANALHTGLPTSSINGTIFSNELPDALPCRSFKVELKGDQVLLNQELFIRRKGAPDKPVLRAAFEQAEQDDFLADYQNFLQQIQNKRNMQNGEVISIAPDAVALLAEMHRILNKGSIVLIDYGFYDGTDRPKHKRQPLQTPFALDYAYPNEDSAIDKPAVPTPYLTDITYELDFEYLLLKCEELSSRTRIQLTPLEQFTKQTLGQCLDFFTADPKKLLRENRFFVLEIKK